MIDQSRRHSGLTVGRFRLEAKRAVRPLVVLAIGAAVGLVAWFILVKNVDPELYTATRQVNFAVANADAVVPGRQEVRFKGIPAGVISAVHQRDGEVVITASIFKRLGPIYRDAEAQLRPNTALEDMYLDIVSRGNPSAGLASESAPVPLGQTTLSVQPSDVLDAFDPDVRSHLSTVLSQFGGGIAKQGVPLRAALEDIAPLVNIATRLTSQLQERGALTKQLIHDTAVLTGTLAQRQTQLRTFVDSTATTLQTIDDNSTAFGETLSELPGTVTDLQSSLQAVQSALPDVDGALTKLMPVATNLPGALRAVSNIATAAKPAVAALQQPVKRLGPLVTTLLPVSADLQRGLSALKPQVPEVGHVTSVIDGCLPGVEAFFQFTPSLVKFGDAREIGIRADLTVDAQSSGTVGDPNVSVLSSCAPGTPQGGAPGLSLTGKAS